MRLSILMSRGIKLSGLLTAIPFGWLQVVGFPSQLGEAHLPTSTQQSSDIERDIEPMQATAQHDSPPGVPAKIATMHKSFRTGLSSSPPGPSL
jgi:hypothetical protein